MMSVTTDVAPDAKVVIRKTWMTWKAMYQCWVFSSTSGRVTSPLNLAIPMQLSALNIIDGPSGLHRQTTGTSDIKTESMTEGNRPVTTPRITVGISLIKLKKGTSVGVISSTLENRGERGRTVSQVVDVTDCTNNGYRNSPEDNHQNDEGSGSELP